MQFTRKTLSRAKRAIACSPFILKALQQMRVYSISLPDIAGNGRAPTGDHRKK